MLGYLPTYMGAVVALLCSSVLKKEAPSMATTAVSETVETYKDNQRENA